jgi:hypothetical protein
VRKYLVVPEIAINPNCFVFLVAIFIEYPYSMFDQRVRMHHKKRKQLTFWEGLFNISKAYFGNVALKSM